MCPTVKTLSALSLSLVAALSPVGCGSVVPSGPAGGGSSNVSADLATVLADYERNPVAVNEKYKGQSVELTGYVVEVTSNLKHQTYASVAAEPAKHRFDTKTVTVWLTNDTKSG
jgi:tRNA_anti-like